MCVQAELAAFSRISWERKGVGANESLVRNRYLLKQKWEVWRKRSLLLIILIIMYIYHALINALSAHMIHINLNMIFYTHVEHSSTKTIYIKYLKKEKRTTNTHTHTHTHTETVIVLVI